jgi:hypothetical protein
LNNRIIRDLVLDDQRFIADIIKRCATMEKLHLPPKGPYLRTAKELEDALVNLYEKILLYNIHASMYLAEPKIGKIYASSAFSIAVVTDNLTSFRASWVGTKRD